MPEITDDPRPLADIVRDYIIAVCERCNWRIARATVLLGISEKTVYNHLHEYVRTGHLEQVSVSHFFKRMKWQRRKEAA